jgi:uroporphyrinogen decarboxylase
MSASAQLSSRERVNRAMERQPHDRVPRHESFWSETIQKWTQQGLEGGQQAVLEELGTDFQGLCWSWPKPFGDRKEVLQEDKQTIVFVDGWGQTTRNWKHKSGTPEHLGWECQTYEDWVEKFRPAQEKTGLHVNVENALANYQKGREKGRWCYLAGAEAFEQTRKLLGDETALIAMASEPEWIQDVSRLHTDMVLRDFQAVLDAGAEPDGVWIYGDMAYNHATMCSPAMYRELIWPDHKRMVEWAHAHGMKFIYHTDGDINGVMDLYVEAGVDCLQPLEAKANVDIRKLVPKYGDRLSFFGNVDIMILATNDRDQIEAEIRAKMEAGKVRNGYIYHSDHSVPPSVDLETYRFVIELVKRLGAYR